MNTIIDSINKGLERSLQEEELRAAYARRFREKMRSAKKIDLTQPRAHLPAELYDPRDDIYETI